jgi:flagellar motor protein MotB
MHTPPPPSHAPLYTFQEFVDLYLYFFIVLINLNASSTVNQPYAAEDLCVVFLLSFLSSLLLSQHGLLRTLQKAMSLPPKTFANRMHTIALF